MHKTLRAFMRCWDMQELKFIGERSISIYYPSANIINSAGLLSQSNLDLYF